MICNFYSPQRVGIEKLKWLIKAHLPKAKTQLINQLGFDILSIEYKEHLLAAPQRLEIAYREASASPKCGFSDNLRALWRFASQIPAFYRRDQARLLAKIAPICSEYSLFGKNIQSVDLQPIIGDLAQATEALVFVPFPCSVARSEQPHFLGKNLQLILDKKGRSAENAQKSSAGLGRKRQSEQFIQQMGIEPPNLPLTEDAQQIHLRPKEEIIARLQQIAENPNLAAAEQAAVWLWWLGLWPNLGLTSSQPALILEIIANLAYSEKVENPKISQLLAQFDLYYRLETACAENPSLAIGELVRARWAAFGWLLRLEETDH